MQRIGDLLKELGFNKDAPLETQKAFVKHLIRAANNSNVAPLPATSPVLKEKIETAIEKPAAKQLSFDPDVLGFSYHDPLYRKAKP